MDKIFDLYLDNADRPESGAYAELSLPATPYEMLDVLDEPPDSVFDMLDFEKIGRELRLGEGGVFVKRSMDYPGGYVVRHSDLAETHKEMDQQPKAPDYTILLKVSKGFFNDPAYDSGRTVQLKLPATSETLDAVLTALDLWDWREAGWSCLDCKGPSLIEILSEMEDINAVNDLAQRLADMEPEALNVYKALLSAVEIKSLQQAEQLMDTLDQYILSPQYSSPIDAAKGELSVILTETEAKMIAPHLNLYQYGQELIQKRGGILTGYGLIERKDHTPVQTAEEQPCQGGMEMVQ